MYKLRQSPVSCYIYSLLHTRNTTLCLSLKKTQDLHYDQDDALDAACLQRRPGGRDVHHHHPGPRPARGRRQPRGGLGLDVLRGRGPGPGGDQHQHVDVGEQDVYAGKEHLDFWSCFFAAKTIVPIGHFLHNGCWRGGSGQ